MDITQPDLIPMPWATNGAKQDPIPEEQGTPGNGRASWKTGFPTENTVPVSSGGVPANYQDFQGVLYTLSEFACYQQAGGMFTWDATIDYQNGARVLGSDGKAYIATGKNGPATSVVNPVGDTTGKWLLDANMPMVSSAASGITSDYVTSGGYTINGGITVNGTITSGGVVHLYGNETISGTKTFASTISGNITGSASSAGMATSAGSATSAGKATQLATARTIQTNLGATSAASFNGTANVTPGVSGTLAVANGGTGVTAIADIQAGKDGAGNVITSTYVDNATYSSGMAQKADINGYYANMTVGNAEQLISDDYVTEKVPYNFRTAGGNADIGDREYDELVGGTLVWNQIVQNGNFETTSSWVNSTPNTLTFSVSNNIATIASNADNTDSSIHVRQYYSPSDIKGHKYLASIEVWTDNENTSATSGYQIATFQFGSGVFVHAYASTPNTWEKTTGIVSASQTSTNGIIRLYNKWANTTNKCRNCVIIDLTAMFGTAIADYIYSLETNEAGAGVAWFIKLFPKAYYSYKKYTLMSVNAVSHDTVGFNAYNPTSGTAVLVGGNQYQISGTYTAISYTDVNGNAETLTPDGSGLFTPTNNGTMTVTGGNATDTCVHLVWSGYRNGEWEEYEKHSYPLDSSLTLLGVPTLDASNNMVYNGDTYASDGTVARRYASINLGSLSWSYQAAVPDSTTNLDRFYSSGLASVIPNFSTSTLAHIICSDYVTDTAVNLFAHTLDKTISSANGNIQIYDSAKMSMTGAQFKTAMDGVYLVYELATPTTETADAYQNPQIVSDFGTEQYVDAGVAAGTRDVAIPVGHDTRYIANLVDKLRRLPNVPAADGNYLINYDTTTRRMSCTEYTDGGRITDLETKLPDAPAADGTYTLQVTVADGEPTYSWV